MAFPRSSPLLGIAVVLTASVIGCQYIPERINVFADHNDRKERQQSAKVKQLLEWNTFEEKRPDPKKQKKNLMFTKARLLESDEAFDQAVKHYQEILESDP